MIRGRHMDLSILGGL
jgi:3-oxoacid CoA-transferase subunit B